MMRANGIWCLGKENTDWRTKTAPDSFISLKLKDSARCPAYSRHITHDKMDVYRMIHFLNVFIFSLLKVI